MKQLWPSIDAIARKLFEPSDLIIQKWVEDSSCLDKALIASLEKNELAREKREDFLSAISEIKSISSEHPQIVQEKMPEELFSILSRRKDLAGRQFSDVPKRGQIRLIETLTCPEGVNQIDLANPLAVCLCEPTEAEGVWYGYGAASETAYAGYWDFVLEDVDAPFDPMAGMIQIWNPVNIVVTATTTKVLAELSDIRMKTLENLVNDYIYGEDTDVKDAYPGTLAIRWIDGHRVLTGSPIGGSEDPRLRYQQLYHARFEPVRALAAEQLYEAEQPEPNEERAKHADLIDQLVEGIAKWAEKFNQSWVAEPSVIAPMSARPKERSTNIPESNGMMDFFVKSEQPSERPELTEYRYSLNGRLIMSFVLRLIDEATIVEVHLLLKGEGELRVIPSKDSLELPSQILSAASPSATIAFTTTSYNVITIEDDGDVIEVPLTGIFES